MLGNTDIKKLHPDLQVHLIDGPLGCQMIHHPLVIEIVIYDVEMINHRYETKLKRVAKAKEACDWSSYVFMHERPYRAEALFEIIHSSSSSCDKLAGEVWIDSENIYQYAEDWLDILLDTDPTKFMTKEDNETLAGIRKQLSIEVYRGTPHPDNEIELSWTISREKAEYFANRFHKNGVVKRKTVKTKDIFAYLGGRGESEVILL